MLPIPGGNILCAKGAGWAKAEGRTGQEWRPAGNTAEPRGWGGSRGNKREQTLTSEDTSDDRDRWLAKH